MYKAKLVSVAKVHFFLLLVLALLLPFASAEARQSHEDRIKRHHDAYEYRLTKRFERYQHKISRICEIAEEYNFENLLSLCDDPAGEPDPDPEPEPEPSSPTLELTADPSTVANGAETTLTWESENAEQCEASGDWSGPKSVDGSEMITITTNSTFVLECSNETETVMQSVEVIVEDPEPEPEPNIDHLVISEVMYDLANDGSQGSEASGRNEWVEIYNPTNDPVDLQDWEIGNGSSNDVIASESLVLDPGAYLVITNATTTADFWDFTGVAVVYLESSISGGLSNSGDVVKLFDNTLIEIDAVSYGGVTEAFDPGAPDVPAGSSLARTSLDVDTDSATDWSESEPPTPGS